MDDLTATPGVGTPAPVTSATPASATPAVSTTPSAAQAIPAGGQTPAGTPGAQPTGWEYQKDPRWGKVFKTEADIIQAYHSLEDVHEKKYKPSFQRLTDLEKKFSDNKFDLTKVDEYIKNYSKWSSPDNPRNQLWQSLNELVSDDLSAQDFQTAVARIREEKLARQYPGMTTEMRKQAIERDNKLKELESWKGDFEYKQSVASERKTVADSEKQIRELCTQKGFEFTDQIKQEFWKYCIDEVKAGKMTTSQMPYVFLMKYGKELDGTYENKIKSGMLEQQNQTKATTVSFAKKPADNTGKKFSIEDRLRSAFDALKKPATTT